MAARLVVTGANGALGRIVLQQALGRAGVELVALVRSAAAAAELPPLPAERARVAQVAWQDSAGLAAACSGASGLIHLAGVLIESRAKRHVAANVATTQAAIAAARSAGVAKLVLVSAVFADARSANPYWRTKGQAEELVRASGLVYTILRCPLVLACKSEGARAIAREACAPVVPLPGGGANLEQPIDARDVADGTLAAALDVACARDATLDLIGPESLPARELVRRAARLRGREPYVVPVPVALVRLALELRGRLLGPGFSPAVLEVLLAETRLDPAPAAKALGLTLRPLDEMLEETLRLEGVR